MGLLIPERCTTLSVDGDESIISDGTLIAGAVALLRGSVIY